MNDTVIYLDNNATTKTDDAVIKEMLPYFSAYYGNAASSTHRFGWQANDAVETARKKIANYLDCEAGEIIFTSGASESIYLSITGIYNAYKGFRNKIISTTVEHKAVLNVLDYLETLGVEVVKLSVDRQGYIDLNELEYHLNDNTFLVAIQLCNNETGVIQPMEKISELAHKYNTPVFSDATQAPGKMLFSANDLGIDCMPISGHKIYGPKGIGALYTRRKNPRVIIKSLVAGNHEKNIRSGTYNVPGIVGLGKATELLKINEWEEVSRLSKLRTQLEQSFISNSVAFTNGSVKDRLSNTCNLCFEGVKATQLIKLLPQIAFSLGSACTSNLNKPSHVLTAMGLTPEQVSGSIRISLGRFTTQEEINEASVLILEAVKKINI